MDNLGNLTISHTGTTSTTTKKSVVSDTNTSSYKVSVSGAVATVKYTTTTGTITSDTDGGKYTGISSALRTAYGIPSGLNTNSTYHSTDGNTITLTVPSTTSLGVGSGYNVSVTSGVATITSGSATTNSTPVSGTFSNISSTILGYYGLTSTSYSTGAKYTLSSDGTLNVTYSTNAKKDTKALDSNNSYMNSNDNVVNMKKTCLLAIRKMAKGWLLPDEK